jgi:hypothetical protein
MRRILLALSVVSLAACSSDPVTVDGTDAASDVGTPNKDAGKDATATDATADGAPSDATTSLDALPDVVIPADAISLGCNSPADCGDAGTPFCCATLVSGAGSPPNCPIASLTSSCKSTCATIMTFTCNSTSTVRGCAQNSDCTESTYPKCCTFADTFCTSQGISQFAQSCK